ncbi:MAG TPA: phosphate ABC transporter permease PstA [Vineibacter sp.]|nr:phosphate ABC transporter permease PstA [Vineibacter sp.]
MAVAQVEEAAVRADEGFSATARIARARRAEAVFVATGIAVTCIGVITLMALMAGLAYDGWSRITPDFFLNFPSRRAGQAGILSAWVGSMVVMLVCAAVAIPIGVGAGVYLEEYAAKNWFTDLIEINVNNLAGVPSIVYGLLALGLFVYGLGLGQSVATAGLTLALLILPIVIVATRESVRAVPFSIREAAYGVGATKWQVTRHHVLPSASSGVATGVIIGLSRALGETAPLVTIGALSFIAFLPTPPVQAEFPFVSFQWLMDPFTVMPIQMFNWVSRPDPAFQSNAAAAGLVLLVMTLLMNGFAIWFRIRMRRKVQW